MSENVAALKQKIEQLEELHRLAQSLSSILNVYETLESISACCAKLCQAEHASLVLFGSAADESVETVVRTAATTEICIISR